MKTQQTLSTMDYNTLPRPDFWKHLTHYDLPTPLTIEGIREVLKDEPDMIRYIERSDSFDSLLRHSSIFDTLIGINRELINNRNIERVADIRSALTPEQLAALPATIQGFTQDRPEYWLEPYRAPSSPDATVLKWTVGGTAHMAPRFMEGMELEVEEIFNAGQIAIGEVYLIIHKYAESCAASFDLGRVYRVHENRRVEFDMDFDPRPEGITASFSLGGGLHFQKGAAVFQMFRVLGYAPYSTFAGVRPHWFDFEHRVDWTARQAWHDKCTQDRINRNARRRELYAQKQAAKARPVKTRLQAPDFNQMRVGSQHRMAA